MNALLIGASGAAAAAAGIALGLRHERRIATELVDALERESPPSSVHTVSPKDFDGLPAPVERYLRRMIRPGTQRIRLARLRQSGSLRTDPSRDRWLPFEATHEVAPSSPGFVWNARVGVGPLLHVRVVDSLCAGSGASRVSLLSVLRVAGRKDRPELTSGALHRFLAEAPWYPTALLPSASLRWSAIDDDRALATLTEKETTVALEFRFRAQGEIASIFTPARWGAFAGEFRQVPWEGRFGEHRIQGGWLVPAEAEVGWHLDGAWQSVWKGRVEGARYELYP